MRSTPEQESVRRARETLQEIEERRCKAAGRLPESASWYDTLWLVYIGGLVLSMALPTPINFLAIALLLFGLIKAMNLYQERYGVWVSGFRPGKTRVISAVLAVLLIVTLLAVSYFRHQQGLIWPAFPAAVIAMSLSYVLARMWMRAYRREIGQS